MIYDADEYARLRNAALCVSLAGWIVLLTTSRPSTCCFVAPVRLASLRLMAGDWALMLIAMMTPTLVAPVYYICLNSFARRRVRSITLFVIGYFGIWMAAGCVFFGVKFFVESCTFESYLPASVAAFIALCWQVSPIKQRALNRSHRHGSLTAFGASADWDALRLGFSHGLWCTCSCWAAMLFPMLLPRGHFAAMFAVGVLMFCERLDPPETPSWRWRGFRTAWSYLILRLGGAQCEPVPWASTDEA